MGCRIGLCNICKKERKLLFRRKESDQETGKRAEKTGKRKATQNTQGNPDPHTAVSQQQTCWYCPLSLLQFCAACRGLLAWSIWEEHGLPGCFRSLQRSGISRSHICNSACSERPSDGELNSRSRSRISRRSTVDPKSTFLATATLLRCRRLKQTACAIDVPHSEVALFLLRFLRWGLAPGTSNRGLSVTGALC